MNRKEFFKVSAAASLASLLSPLSAYAEKFESEGKKVKVAVIEVYLPNIFPIYRNARM